jgi:hypothetical protein
MAAMEGAVYTVVTARWQEAAMAVMAVMVEAVGR